VSGIRRLTILFADLVGSTALSNRVVPETYRMLVGRYRGQVVSVVNRFEGHIGSTKGGCCRRARWCAQSGQKATVRRGKHCSTGMIASKSGLVEV
jgi:class 3 adenylate cyclase